VIYLCNLYILLILIAQIYHECLVFHLKVSRSESLPYFPIMVDEGPFRKQVYETVT